MHPDNLAKQVAFIKEIDKLKIYNPQNEITAQRPARKRRRTQLAFSDDDLGSEHSDKPIDVLKVLKMVLIHDLVEIDAGDTFIYDAAKNHTNTDEELLAAKRIFGLLPDEQAQEFIAIRPEFEYGQTDEARFARAMDRCEPLLQNSSNKGGTWAEFNVPYQKVYDKKKAIKGGSETIWEYAEKLINEGVEKGILKKWAGAFD